MFSVLLTVRGRRVFEKCVLSCDDQFLFVIYTDGWEKDPSNHHKGTSERRVSERWGLEIQDDLRQTTAATAPPCSSQSP